jgi:hypothetical protein
VVIVTAIVTMLVVFAIAAGAVGREAQLLDAVPARPVFDPEEATTWIAEHLPSQVTASLSYDDVQRIVNWTLALLRTSAAVARTSGEVPDAGRAVIVDEDRAVDHVMGEAARAHLVLQRDEARTVIVATLDYLEVIGAVGPEPGPDEEVGR